MTLVCGIYERRAPAAVGGLDAMLAALPGCGDFEQSRCGAVAMASRELASGPARIEPRGGAAPGLAIAADVRLDNRAELRDALGLAAPARGAPDWQLVLGAYRRWGQACPERLVGDYAFAIWDAGLRRMFCARDAAGARPFYFAALPERFVFASDVAAVRAAPGVNSDLDDSYVAAVLLRRAPGGSHTFFRAVRTLPPGHGLTVDAETLRIERWWRPEDIRAVYHRSDDDCAEAFLDLYERAVQDRLRGARSVGAHLSGGLDSSSIAVLAAREQRRRGQALQVFCWHPPPRGPLSEAEAVEYGLIEAVCAREGLRPVYHDVDVRHMVATLRRDGTAEPDRDGTLMHEHLVQRSAAQRGVDVLLSGWGGDEGVSFNGRGYYVEMLRAGHLRSLYRAARAESDRPLKHLLANAVLANLRRAARRTARRAARRLGWDTERGRTFVNPAFAGQAQRLRERDRHSRGGRKRVALVGMGHLAARIEDWAASGARHGIEYRYPLLDRRLLEFALGLPPDQFRRGRWDRWLMRNALQSVLPREGCWHRSKRDPARFEPALAALTGALPTVRRHLVARRATPVRAKYLDMPRLMASLDADVVAQPGKLQAALRILDW